MGAVEYPRANQGALSRAVYFILAFMVAHLFLWPVMCGLVCWLAIRWFGVAGAAFVAACIAAYIPFYLDGSEKTDRRFWPTFASAWWTGCHYIWNVRTLLPTPGGGWSDTPADSEAHRAVLNVEKQTFVFGLFPHGAVPLGGAVLRPQVARWPWLSERLRVGVADVVFRLPGAREFYQWFGSLSAGWRPMLAQLRAGKSVLLLPGGIKEQLTLCKPGEDVVVLRERRGFVKLALLTGSPLVPVYVFGERRAFKVQETLTRVVGGLLKRMFRAGVPCVRGRWFTLMPFSTPITIVFGHPIPVPKKFVETPSAAAGATESSGGSGAASVGDSPSSPALDVTPRPDASGAPAAVNAAAGAGAAATAAVPSTAAASAAGEQTLEAAVDELHSRFTEALVALYEKHKHECSYGDVKLVVQ